MGWSKEPPTEPGSYWVHDTNNELVHVAFLDEDLDVRCWWLEKDCLFLDETAGWEWFYPMLEMPPDPSA